MYLGDQVQNLPAPTTSGFPTIVGPNTPPNPYQGMTWLNSNDNKLSVYSNGAWIQVSTGGGGEGGLTETLFVGAITDGVLTKVTGELSVIRVSKGVFDVYTSVNAGLIVNLPDNFGWGEHDTGFPDKRRIMVRNEAVLGRSLADPEKFLIMGIT